MLALDEVLVEVARPPGGEPKGEGKDAVKPTFQPQKVGLDTQLEDVFKFKLLWTPSPDRIQDKTLTVKLKASFDENWIIAEKEREVHFEGADNERTLEDGVREKEVRWPVKMVAGKERRVGEAATSLLRISIDAPAIGTLNQSRAIAAAPLLQINQPKSRVDCPITLRNQRAVSLSFRRGDRSIGIRRDGSAFEIHEIPMLANRDFSFEWVVRNDSPIPVKVKAQLWAVEHSDEWTSPWGRIPTDDRIGNKGGPLRPTRKRPLAEYEFAQLGINENRVKEIPWTAPAADAPKADQSVTAGVYCLLTVDGEPNREYWVEFVPWEPRSMAGGKREHYSSLRNPFNFEANIKNWTSKDGPGAIIPAK